MTKLEHVFGAGACRMLSMASDHPKKPVLKEGDGLAHRHAVIKPTLSLHPPTTMSGTVDSCVVQGMVLGVLLLALTWPASSALVPRLLSVQPGGGQGREWWRHPAAAFYSSLVVVVGGVVPLWLKQVVGLEKHPIIWYAGDSSELK